PAPPSMVTRSFAKVKEECRKELVKALDENEITAEDLGKMAFDERLQFVKGAFLEAFGQKADSDLTQLLEGKKVTFIKKESKAKQALFQEALDSPQKIFAGRVQQKHKDEVTGKSPRFDVKLFSPVVTAYLVALGKSEAQIKKVLEDRQKIAMQLHFVQDEV